MENSSANILILHFGSYLLHTLLCLSYLPVIQKESTFSGCRLSERIERDLEAIFSIQIHVCVYSAGKKENYEEGRKVMREQKGVQYA